MPNSNQQVITPVKTQISVVPSLLIRPVAKTDEVIKAWQDYQELKSRLLNENDYQVIQGKKYIKKSGWRKLQTAFGISDQLINEQRKEIGKHFMYEITVKVSSANGRFAFGVGSCCSSERNFSHVDHDVRSTAHTRAKNRAISDLIGGGEVSAEEIETPASSPIIKAPVIDVVEDVAEYNAGKNYRAFEDGGVTEKQVNLLTQLLTEKVLDEEERMERINSITELSKSEASAEISRLINNCDF